MATEKVTLGSAHPHIKASRGGEKNVMNFYCTTNETTYGSHWAKFEPRIGYHEGAGYVPNERPYIPYRAKLDEIDNPAMGKIVAQNYCSVTQKDFKPFDRPFGKEPLPSCLYQTDSGFTKLDTKEPVKEDPMQHVTEYRTGFYSKPLQRPIKKNAAIGPREDTGFTSNSRIYEAVTHHYDDPSCGCRPGWMNDRPIGRTYYQTDYNPYGRPYGREPLPKLSDTGDWETGFTKNGKCITSLDPVTDGTCYKDDYKGLQGDPPTLAQRLGREDVGNKESSGYLANEKPPFIMTRDNPQRFVTHYMTKFYDPTVKGYERQGHVNMSVNPVYDDGYTKNSRVTDIGKGSDAFNHLNQFDHYQSKSIITREALPTVPTKALT